MKSNITPCKHCGGERYKSPKGSLLCRPCNGKRTRKWAIENSEKQKTYLREYNIRNRDDLSVKQKQYARENRTRLSSSQKEWRESQGPLYKTWLGINVRCGNVKSKNYADWGGRGIEVYEPWRVVKGQTYESRLENRKRFQNFRDDVLRLIGPKKNPTDTIERLRNNEGYKPGNIDWTSRKVQANNRRSNRAYRLSISENSPIEYDGRIMTIKEFSEMVSLPLIVTQYRYAQHGNANWILDDDFNNRDHLYNGHKFGLVELELYSGVGRSTIAARLKSGWTVEQAIETPAQDTKYKPSSHRTIS